MGFSGDITGIARWRRQMLDLADSDGKSQRAIAQSVAFELKSLIREEFATGEGPYGAWPRTKSGDQAMQSRKLPNAFSWRFDRGILRFIGKVKRDWLRVHQEGHTFPSRSVGERDRFLTFKNGKLVKNRRALNRRGQAVRGIVQIFAGAHKIGRRILPERPIVPTGILPAKWANAINLGARMAMLGWYRG